jgi:hypothetical protein
MMDLRCPLHTLQVFSESVTRIKSLLQTCGYNGQRLRLGNIPKMSSITCLLTNHRPLISRMFPPWDLTLHNMEA